MDDIKSVAGSATTYLSLDNSSIASTGATATWSDTALPGADGNLRPDTASPISSCAVATTTMVHVITSDGHLHQITHADGASTYVDISESTKRKWQLQTSGPLTSLTLSNGSPRVYTTTAGDNLVQEFVPAQDGTWSADFMSASAPVSSLLGSFTRASGAAPVVNGIAGWGGVQELVFVSGQGWSFADLNEVTSAPPAVVGSIACSSDADEKRRVYYVDRNGHLQELSLIDPQPWWSTDVTMLAGAPSAALSTPLTCHVVGARQSRVYFRSTDGHVQALAQSEHGIWTATDLTAALPGVPSPAELTQLVSCVTGDGYTRVYYTDASAHIHELSLAPSALQWQHADVSDAANGAIPFDPPGSAPRLSVSVLSSGEPRLYYLGQDQFVHELAGGLLAS